MTDILAIVSDTERNVFPTLSQLSENDVASIWGNVSTYIERQMTLQKGVHVAGLGTFTFSQQRLDVGNKFIMIQRPIFLLEEKLAHSHGLKQARPLAAATHVPVVQLNYTALALESPYDRDVVERCVRETLLLLLRAVASNHSILLTFQGIGALSFKQRKVRMKFTRDFVNAMDGTGKLLLAFSNRPGTSASLISGSSFQRPQTTDPITLPSISEGGACPLLPLDSDPGRKRACTLLPPDSDPGQRPRTRQAKSRQTLQPAKVIGVSLPEDLNSIHPVETTDRATISILPPEGTLRVEEPHENLSCTGHMRAGQRAQRNIPLYLKEERQAEEQAEELHLLLREHQKDKLYLQKEQAVMREQRKNAQKVAAFNLGVAEAVREDKAHCPQYHSSFVFPGRPFTPPRGPNQRWYMDELQAQVARKSQKNAQLQQDKLLLESLDQVQLGHEIASQKSQKLQQKREEAKHYQRALDIQVEEKKDTGLPQPKPTNTGFCRFESPASITESRERAQKVFQEQLNTATQKRRDELLNRQSQQEKERDMLSRNRRGLIMDRINRFEKMRNLRASLEDSWRRSVILKCQQEEEEKRFLRSGGHLLIDQCQQYRRCHQCKRRTSNSGESTVWKDSRLNPPSRLMI